MIEILLSAIVVLLFFLLRQVSALRADSDRLKNIEYLLMELDGATKQIRQAFLDQSQAVIDTLESSDRALDDIRQTANIYERYRLPSQSERVALDELAVHDEVMHGISANR
ncbi:MAG: hypothetical protein HGA47_01925 [Zoogloea sp.]|nr:hypothetical protein [Zoogloea sp.]